MGVSCVVCELCFVFANAGVKNSGAVGLVIHEEM